MRLETLCEATEAVLAGRVFQQLFENVSVPLDMDTFIGKDLSAPFKQCIVMRQPEFSVQNLYFVTVENILVIRNNLIMKILMIFFPCNFFIYEYNNGFQI